MIGDGGNGSAELGADLRVLGVGVGETGGVVEDIGDQLDKLEALNCNS